MLTRIIFILFYLLHFLPLPVLHLLAYPLGYLAYFTLSKRRRIGMINLRLCFPEKSQRERQSMLRANFYHMAAMLLEYSFCWYASAQRIKRYVHIEGEEYLYQATKHHQHVLLLCPHFCAFELSALRLNLHYSLISIFTGQKNPVWNQRLYDGRTRFDVLHHVHLIRRNEKIISIIHLLKNSSALFLYLPDQDFGRKDSIFVPFFGVPTATTTGVSRLSNLTKRHVIPMIPIRHFGRLQIKIFPPCERFPTTDISADTTRINQLIEYLIRQHPTQYFWLHQRFKTRPPGEKSVY